MADRHKFVFIGGLHRSGTWLHTHALESHSDVSRLATANREAGDTFISKLEGQFLQTVYPDDSHYGGVGRLGFHPEVHLTEHSTLLTPDNRRRLFNEWEPYWDLNKPFLLEKTPTNLLRSRFLQAIFPASYFIFIVRHPVAVALAQQKWSGTSISSLIEHWLICHEILKEDIPFLDNSLLIHYEETINDPVRSLGRIRALLGIGSHTSTQKVIDGNRRYFDTWNHALGKEDHVNNLTLMRKVRNLLMPKLTNWGHPLTILSNEAKICVLRFEERVNQFGYSLQDPDTFQQD